MKCVHPFGEKTKQIFGIAALFMLLLPSCGSPQNTNQPQTSATCEPGTVQIGVMDGMLRRICGCTEANGVTFTGKTFACTLPVNSRLFFYFIGTHIQHRIVINGTLKTTVQVDPSDDIIQVDANILMDATGAFNFEDANDNSLGGIFTVI